MQEFTCRVKTKKTQLLPGTVLLHIATKYKAVQPGHTEALYKPLNITENSRTLVDLSTEKDH